jgi:hypothetical protein
MLSQHLQDMLLIAALYLIVKAVNFITKKVGLCSTAMFV